MIARGRTAPFCVLPAGEEAKNWTSAEAVLGAAREAGLGRDGLFIAVGGGVVSDLAAFAASVYMRGARLCIVSTTLLGMVDAAAGGKTGFDLFGVKNLAGTFFPAAHVYLPLLSLKTLPASEWKSGMAELIKTAVLGGDEFLSLLASLAGDYPAGSFVPRFPPPFIRDLLGKNTVRIMDCLVRAVEIKGRIVEEDPKETGTRRALLNLGHTFGHALESSAGLGRISHGEAVAWGMARACELGLALGITPEEKARNIGALLGAYGYEIGAPHPLMGDPEGFMKALEGDKKKRRGSMVFVVPGGAGARLADETLIAQNSLIDHDWKSIIKKLIAGERLS
jgi:3-dehydroquinate synthase